MSCLDFQCRDPKTKTDKSCCKKNVECLSIPADNRSPGFVNILIMGRSIALAFNPQQRTIEWYQLSADTSL